VRDPGGREISTHANFVFMISFFHLDSRFTDRVCPTFLFSTQHSPHKSCFILMPFVCCVARRKLKKVGPETFYTAVTQPGYKTFLLHPIPNKVWPVYRICLSLKWDLSELQSTEKLRLIVAGPVSVSQAQRLKN